MQAEDGVAFEIDFDFVDHRLVVGTSRGEVDSIELVDGLFRVNQEAYSHEVVSFGFWAGDANVREPASYSYTAPEPAGLRRRPLRPA